MKKWRTVTSLFFLVSIKCSPVSKTIQDIQGNCIRTKEELKKSFPGERNNYKRF